MVELIYCADGNARCAAIAKSLDYTYGARLPARGLPFAPGFADQEYKRPNRAAYMRELATHRPRLATVLDLERPEQFEDVMSWAAEAAQYVSEAVIIIPKYPGAIAQLPRQVGGIPVRLGYSVPTSYGGTLVDTAEFAGWPVHLLGGSPRKQIDLSRSLNVVSADTNYDAKIAHKAKAFLNRGTRFVVSLYELGYPHIERDAMYQAFTISRWNLRAAWLHCPAYLRPALPEHVESIKRLSNQYKQELGFVNRAALLQAIERGNLIIAAVGQTVVGFVHYYARRDGWHTIYEIAVARRWRGQKIGAALLASVPLPRRLKVTADNQAARDFYERSMTAVRTEPGRTRSLVVYEAA